MKLITVVFLLSIALAGCIRQTPRPKPTAVPISLLPADRQQQGMQLYDPIRVATPTPPTKGNTSK